MKESVKLRLMAAAKSIFAQKGYENASTAELAREAGTSESQLIKYFGSKEGLLEAIFLDGWTRLEFVFVAARAAATPEDRLRMVFELVIEGFDRDPELMQLLLLEGRRIRKHDSEVILSQGYVRFCTCVDSIMAEMLAQRDPPPPFGSKAATSAVVGLMESLFRDRILQQRIGYPFAAEMPEIRQLFIACLKMLSGTSTQHRPDPQR